MRYWGQEVNCTLFFIWGAKYASRDLSATNITCLSLKFKEHRPSQGTAEINRVRYIFNARRRTGCLLSLEVLAASCIDAFSLKQPKSSKEKKNTTRFKGTISKLNKNPYYRLIIITELGIPISNFKPLSVFFSEASLGQLTGRLVVVSMTNW